MKQEEVSFGRISGTNNSDGGEGVERKRGVG